jgi:hypothetical protein
MALPHVHPPAGALQQAPVHEGLVAGPGTSVLRVVPWEDPATDTHGVDPRSRYVELFWLPVLGPSATWLLRRLVDELDRSPDGVDVRCAELAGALGIGGPQSRHAPLERTLGRCARFGMLTGGGPGVVRVRRRVAFLPRHLLARLPATLRIEHRRWDAETPAVGADPRRLAYQAAVDLAGRGEDRAALERRLLRLGVHPALAYEAAGWFERSAEAALGAVPSPSAEPSTAAGLAPSPAEGVSAPSP